MLEKKIFFWSIFLLFAVLGPEIFYDFVSKIFLKKTEFVKIERELYD